MADRMAKFEASMEAAALNQRLATAQRRVTEVNEAVDRVLAALQGVEGSDAESVRSAGRELKAALREGVDFDGANGQRRGLSALQSSWDAPTTLERLALERMATALSAVEVDLNALLEGAVADFRVRLSGAELDLFPAFQSVGR